MNRRNNLYAKADGSYIPAYIKPLFCCGNCPNGVPAKGKVYCPSTKSVRGRDQVCDCHPIRKEENNERI